MDPCGAVCDYIRRPYTTDCHFFRDSDQAVKIMWYPAKPDAPVLDTPSVIASLDSWVQERPLGIYTGYKVGEVPGATRTFNSAQVKPQANGQHRCGTEDEWANGAVFADATPRPRRADGLPTCCGEMPAGVVVGGPVLTEIGTARAVLGGRFVIKLAGTVFGGGDFFHPATEGPIAVFVSDVGSGVDWLMMDGVNPGETWRFTLRAPTDLTGVRIAGTATFGPGAWFNDFADPTAGNFTWTQTQTTGPSPYAWWELFKPDTNRRDYTVTAEKL